MNPYVNNKNLKIVVLCAGKGARIHMALKEEPKVMIPLRDRPILYYVIHYWKKFARDFIFVVGYKKEDIIRFTRYLPIKANFVEQKKPKGIADAIYCAKNFVSQHFIVVLGDCICRGDFDLPKDMIQGVGVYKTKEPDDIRHSFSVKLKHNLIYEVNEKPKVLPNNLCGMGFYFFDRRVFDYIKNAKPSKLRNEIEITDVIQKMIENKEKISPVFFKGSYININYLKDLQRAEKII